MRRTERPDFDTLGNYPVGIPIILENYKELNDDLDFNSITDV